MTKVSQQKQFNFVYILFIFIFFFTFWNSALSAEWKEYGEYKGIFGYSRYSPNTPYGEIKTVITLPTTLEIIAEVLRDVPAFPEWMESVRESRLIEIIDANKLLVYNVFKFPWTFSDRDVVYKSVITVAPDTGAIYITSVMAGNENTGQSTDHVKTTFFYQQFKLEYIKKQETRVTFTLEIDLNTSLPTSAMKRSVLGSSYLMLEKMNDMVKKDKYKNADALSEQNHEFTKAVIKVKMRQYTDDADLIEYILTNKEILKQVLENENSQEGFSRLLASPLLKSYPKRHLNPPNNE